MVRAVKTRTDETLRRRRNKDIEKFETTELNQVSSKTSFLDVFFQYARARKTKEKDLSRFYGSPMFRQFKFLVHVKKRSSEDKFAAKVFETFKTKYEDPQGEKVCVTDEMKDNNNVEVKTMRDIIIYWGNWGKTSTPNALKGCQPSPGIGLARFFLILIVSEYLTSQTCPCCKSQRCMKNPTFKGITRHHLLRCENDTCHSRWWNRNVLGSFNILEKAKKSTLLKKPRGTDSNIQYLE